MYKLKISNYEVDIPDGNGSFVKRPYDVRGAIASLAMHPRLKLNGYDLLKRQKVVDKIVECKDDQILLEDAEYNAVKHAVMGFEGFSQTEVKLCEQINEAKKVDVAEKTEKG